MDHTKLKTMQQVADELGVTKARVSQLCTSENIDRVELGNQKLLPPSSVLKLKSLLTRKFEKTA